jgi:type II secretory pathway pseudopilin PulG
VSITPAATPYLRTVLPPDALAYVRLAHPWGLLGVPKGNMLSEALASEGVRAAMSTLQGAIVQQLLGPLQSQIGPLPGVLLDQVRSPLELAVLRPTGSDGALPDLLLLVQLRSATRDDANTLLQALAQVEPELQLKAPLDQHGVGRLQVMGFPIFVSFDATSRRLFLLATQNLAPAALTQRLQSLQPRADAPMLPLEAEVDTSGQGFFVWLDAKTIFTLAQSLIPPEQLLIWQRLGAHAIQQIALGMGVSAGKGRFKLILDMPRVGVRTLLPAVEAPLAFDAAGAPEGLVMLSLPNASDWQQAEAFVKTSMPDVDEQLQPFKDAVRAATGLGFDDWLNLFGPELAYVADTAGQYSVIRLRDPEKFATLLEVLQTRYGFRYEKRELHGQTYAHLTLPDVEAMVAHAYPELRAKMATTPVDRLWWRLFSFVPGHLYWKVDGQYLIVAQIPQVLIDRDRIATKTPIKSWLKDVQKLPGDDALFLASAQVEGVPKLIYAAYLQVLQSLGDLAGQPLDLFTLPSAMEVKLPQRGSYGVKFTSSANRLALEATYESNPLEVFFMGGGVRTIAMVGMLTAIAVPNFLEYRRHAEIAQQLSQVTAFKTVMADFYVAQGRFPTEDELSDAFAPLEAAPIAAQIEIEPDTGVIVLYVKNDTLGDHNRVYFKPTPQGGTVQWSCRADFEVKYTLPECR